MYIYNMFSLLATYIERFFGLKEEGYSLMHKKGGSFLLLYFAYYNNVVIGKSNLRDYMLIIRPFGTNNACFLIW